MASTTTISSDVTSSSILSNQSLTTMMVPEVENRTYTLGPPDTIWGLEVEVFSYIFLAIGGVAPVIFLIIVVISMRCYTWRKVRRFKRYEARYRTGMELWESDRRYSSVRDQAKSKHAYDGPGQVISDEESGPSGGSDPSNIRSTDGSGGGEYYQGFTASTNNPNVYFREVTAGTITIPNGHHPNQPQRKRHHSDQTSESTVAPNGDIHRDIATEEQNALDCFNKIYESLDISGSESESLPHISQAPSGRGGLAGAQGVKPRLDRTHSLNVQNNSQNNSTSPQGQRTLPGSVGHGKLPSRPVTGGSLPGTPSRRPMVQITARQPPDTGHPLEQRQSWLHSSFVNVAYDINTSNPNLS